MWTLLLSPAGKGGKGQAASQRLRWRSCGSCQPAFPSLTIPPPPSSTALSTTVLPPPEQRRRRRQQHDLGGSMGASLAPPDPRFSILEGRPPPPGCRALSPIPVVLSIAPPTYLHSLAESIRLTRPSSASPRPDPAGSRSTSVMRPSRQSVGGSSCRDVFAENLRSLSDLRKGG